jgi:flagellum-specific peptidoglycan hydrolase FlgJ
LPTGQFVADAFVRWPAGRPDLPWCAFSASGTPEVGEPFVAWAASYAQQMKATYRVPAAVTIAQAILESGWGRSDLTRDGNSYFGMKCFADPGSNATGCRPYGTHECVGSSCYSTTATFRVYDSVLASFKDHSSSIASLPRYRDAFAHANDPDGFAVATANAGYATSPTYAQDLIRVMHDYQLYRFDAIV